MLTRSILSVLALLGLVACHASSAVPSTTLSVAGGLVTITGRVGSQAPFVIHDAAVLVRVDGQLLSTAGQPCKSSADQPLACDLGNGIALTLSSRAAQGGLLLTAAVSASGAHRVDGFEVLATQASGAGLELPGGQPTALRYLHNGYQSWSFSGVLDEPAGTTLPRTNGVINYPAPDGVASIDETLGLSSHSAVVSGGDGSALVLGYVSTRLWQGVIALESPSSTFTLTAQCGFTGDSVPLGSTPVQSETLFVKYDVSPSAAMGDYGEVLASLQETRPEPPAIRQRGWFSWNNYFNLITEPEVLTQAAAMAPLVGAEGFKLVEIDDGWEQAWGDWTPNAGFDAVSSLASARHAAGQSLGLWMAPFVVEDTEPIVAQHPDWWVKGLDGQTFVYSPSETTHNLMIVDTTQPDALAWAVGNVTALESQGVDFFKLDYLYAAALDGQRSDSNATGVAALTLGLQAIFNAVGPAAINLCGVPWLHGALAPPSTIRTGSDVAYSVGAAGFALVGMAVRDMTARSFGPVSTRSDPDQIWLSPLTPTERQTALTLQALASESFSLSDDLTQLTQDEQNSLVQAAQLDVPTDSATYIESRGLFDSAGSAVVAAIVEVVNGPDEVQTALPSVIVRGQLLAATNWGNSSATTDLQLNAGEKVTPVWGPAPSGGKVQLESHETGLYRLSGG